jgi:hypothetical protein
MSRGGDASYQIFVWLVWSICRSPAALAAVRRVATALPPGVLLIGWGVTCQGCRPPEAARAVRTASEAPHATPGNEAA